MPLRASGQPAVGMTPCLAITLLLFSDDFQFRNLRGSLKRSVRAVQLFGRLAVLETHTLKY